MSNERIITFGEAVREGLEESVARNDSVFLMGQGIDDPSSVWGTTKGIAEKFGADKVMEMPVAENGLTGICIGAAMNGQRPVINLHRVEFALLAMEQIVNNSAKSHYVSNGQHKVPIVIRMVVGRGWGQGPEHSQSLEPIFAQFPGLKVVMPTLAEDAKGMLIAAIEDDNPVMFIEHRVIDKHFDFVGMDEYFSQSLFAICALSGLDKAPIWRDEPRVAPPSTEDLDPELITRIRDLVRIDLAVYERQRELFEKTYAGFLAEFNRTVGSLCINHMARCAG